MSHVVTGVRTSGVACRVPGLHAQTGNPCGRPSRGTAGTNPKTGGHQPKVWQALLFNTVGDHEFFLAFGKCVSEVVRGSFILVWVYVGIGHRVPVVLSCSTLRFSFRSLFFWRCASYVLATVSFARFGPPRAISEVVSLGLPGRPARASPGA